MRWFFCRKRRVGALLLQSVSPNCNGCVVQYTSQAPSRRTSPSEFNLETGVNTVHKVASAESAHFSFRADHAYAGGDNGKRLRRNCCSAQLLLPRSRLFYLFLPYYQVACAVSAHFSFRGIELQEATERAAEIYVASAESAHFSFRVKGADLSGANVASAESAHFSFRGGAFAWGRVGVRSQAPSRRTSPSEARVLLAVWVLALIVSQAPSRRTSPSEDCLKEKLAAEAADVASAESAHFSFRGPGFMGSYWNPWFKSQAPSRRTSPSESNRFPPFVFNNRQAISRIPR